MIELAPSDETIQAVIGNLREINRREVFATRFDQDSASVVAGLAALRPLAICEKVFATDAGAPVTYAGAWLTSPRVASIMLVSTDEWLTVARGVYAWLRNTGIPHVLMPNVHLAEARVLEDGPSRAWLHRLGWIDCLPALPRGANGERYVTMAWINPREL